MQHDWLNGSVGCWNQLSILSWLITWIERIFSLARNRIQVMNWCMAAAHDVSECWYLNWVEVGSEIERWVMVQNWWERAPKAETSALSWDEAVGLIQIHERARQGRLRFLLMKQIRQQKTQQGRGLQKSRTTMTPTQAAHVIQSHWRRLVATNYVDQLRRREMIFLGMVRFLTFVMIIHQCLQLKLLPMIQFRFKNWTFV